MNAIKLSICSTLVTIMLLALYISFHSAYAQDHEKENAHTMDISPVNAKAKATFKNKIGQEIGTATLTQSKQGVLIALELSNIEPGFHAFHIHETGKCTPMQADATPERGIFTDSGSHFNPHGHDHGLMMDNGPHAGDMVNLYASDTGLLMAQIMNDRISLTDDGKGNNGKAYIFDEDGSAFIIHEGMDDYESQPTGAAGGRVACAVIEQE